MTPPATPPRPGEARCPDAPSMAEVMNRETAQPAYLAENYSFLGDGDIAYERYTSPEFMQAELKKMWPRVWQWACREEQIPQPNDYIVYDLGPYSFIIIRNEQGQIRAFYNSCMHRGTKLRPNGAEGNSPQITCPFHGWTWNSNGELQKVVCGWDFPHVDAKSHALRSVRCDTWGGFVFITMDESAPLLRDYMGVIPDHVSHLRMENRYIAAHVQKILPANWKAAQEAFTEAYHVAETHPQLLMSVADANGQYDIFGDHVSRRLGTLGIPSPHVKDRPSEQELIDFLTRDARSNTGERIVLKPGETARQAMIKHIRETMEKTYGIDTGRYADSEVADTIEYHLFPNMLLFPSLLLSMAYRFRPHGSDPDKSVFELMFLRPVPDDGPRPEPAPLYMLGEDDSYTTVPELGEGMGRIYDQDTGNLRMQQEGFYAAGKPGQTLGNYQEVRTRHVHLTLDKYLAR
jgi:phenylpropionate dioxygenase-like ring-hydroxylating dioxygenase large terminal subunit